MDNILIAENREEFRKWLLCFGWIDSTLKEVNGVRMQRFTPRKKNSPWTELNKERLRAADIC